jgi:hypothetical protein
LNVKFYRRSFPIQKFTKVWTGYYFQTFTLLIKTLFELYKQIKKSRSSVCSETVLCEKKWNVKVFVNLISSDFENQFGSWEKNFCIFAKIFLHHKLKFIKAVFITEICLNNYSHMQSRTNPMRSHETFFSNWKLKKLNLSQYHNCIHILL